MNPDQALNHLTALVQQFVNTLPPVVAQSVARDAQAAIQVLGATITPAPTAAPEAPAAPTPDAPAPTRRRRKG